MLVDMVVSFGGAVRVQVRSLLNIQRVYQLPQILVNLHIQLYHERISAQQLSLLRYLNIGPIINQLLLCFTLHHIKGGLLSTTGRRTLPTTWCLESVLAALVLLLVSIQDHEHFVSFFRNQCEDRQVVEEKLLVIFQLVLLAFGSVVYVCDRDVLAAVCVASRGFESRGYLSVLCTELWRLVLI